MGKKKSKKDKKKGGKVVELPPLPTRFDEMMLAELEDEVKTLQKQQEKAQIDRNFAQLERDTIAEFYEVIKKENRQLELETMAKDRDMELMEDNHRVEVKVYVQKVKHLSYEHSNTVKRVAGEVDRLIEEEVAGHALRSVKLRDAKKERRLLIKEKEAEFESEITNEKQKYEKRINLTRSSFQHKLEEFEQRCEERLRQLKTDLELRRKVEMHEIHERKNLHINDLMRNHAQAFGQIKHYYNEITHDNLKLIKNLKTAVSEMEKNALKHQKTMFKIAQENKDLKDPLVQVLKEVEELERQLKDYGKDKLSLKNAASRLQLLEGQWKSLNTDHTSLERKYDAVERERDALYESFESTVTAMHRKSEMKNLKLSKQLELLGEEFNKKAAQFNEVLTAANLDPAVFSSVTEKLDQVLQSRNTLIQDLQYAVARATKAHNDTVRTYESRLLELGVPPEEIGFKEMPSSTSVGPAGLVVKSLSH